MEILIHIFVSKINYNDIEFNEDYHHTYMKNLHRIKPFPNYAVEIRTDSHGFRSKEIGYEKSPNTKRIIVLGDSVTANIGVPDNRTYTDVLSSDLNSKDSVKWEVINRGVEAWGTDNQYLYFFKEGHKYNSDIVILQFTVSNDFTEVFDNGMVSINEGKINIKTKYEIPSVYRRINLFLNQRSGIYRLFANFAKPIYIKYSKQKYVDFGSAEYNSKAFLAFNQTTMLISEFKSYADSKNIEFIVFVYRDPRETNEEYYNYWKEKQNTYNNYVPRSELNVLGDAFVRFLSENNISYVEAKDVIKSKQDLVSIDDGHMGSEGSEKAGHLLSAYITGINMTMIKN